MTPPPVPLGLALCNLVIIDQHSRMPSLIGMFTGLEVDRFPSDPQRFSVFAALTDGLGNGRIEWVALRLETGEQVYAQNGTIDSPDRLKVVNVNFRVRGIIFPAPGSYEFAVLVDGDVIARRRVRIYEPRKLP